MLRRNYTGSIKSLRNFPTVQGSIYFSSKSFYRNPNGWNDSLRNNYYRYPALIHPMEWLPEIRPAVPAITSVVVNDSMVILISKPTRRQDLKGYVVYAGNSEQINISDARNIICITGVQDKITIQLPLSGFIKVTAISKTNHESGVSNVVNAR